MNPIDKLFGKKKKKPKKTKAKKLSKNRVQVPKKSSSKKIKLTEKQKEDKDLRSDIENSQKKDKRGLLPRQLLFIKHHLLGINDADAAIKAGYSAKSAAAIASELLTKKPIQKEIKRRVKSVIARVDDKISKMIEHLYICSYYNPLDIVTESGGLKGDRETLGDLAYAITGIETKLNSKGDRYTIIKLADKKSAREQLGKYLQMFTDKIELTGGLTLNIGKPPELPKPQEDEDLNLPPPEDENDGED